MGIEGIVVVQFDEDGEDIIAYEPDRFVDVPRYPESVGV